MFFPLLKISQRILSSYKHPLVWLFFFLIAVLQGCSTSSSVPKSNRQADVVPPIRAIQVDLDYVYDPDIHQQQANLEILVKRVQDLGVNAVFLQAFADPTGSGTAESLYFSNRFLPVRKNLFVPVAQALRSTGVAVYGWLPMLAFIVPNPEHNLYVQQNNDTEPVAVFSQERRRLSPFNPRSRALIEGIYQDFAAQTVIDGILFHDDGVLSDFEDASPAALAEYQRAGLSPNITVLRSNRKTMRQWSRFKTEYLIDFSLKLLKILRKKQPKIRSVRNIFAGPVLQAESETWFAQSLPLFLQAYDYTALMAMPFMEQAKKPDRWLEQLCWSALNYTTNGNSIIFELQTKNWKTGKPINTDILQHQITLLAQLGVTSFAYYPDDFHKNQPPANMVRPCLANPETCSGWDGT